jgi:protein TonB
MRPFLSQITARFSERKSQFVSIAVHVAAILFVLDGVHPTARIKPYRLPGTDKGDTLLTYYAPGSFHPIKTAAEFKSQAKAKPVAKPKQTLEAPKVQTSEPASKTGVGAAAESGLGEGDITIALQSYFPYPKPDLSALPHGTRGDVVLNAVIDENGKIKELTLIKGLGSPIDQQVIATVEKWTYTPAMRRGVPVPSEQELHFHYERG